MLKRILLVLSLAACSGSTGPKGLDPTVLITNNTTTDTLFFTWRDGQNVLGGASVLPSATGCERFAAQADSAYFQLVARHNGAETTMTAAWFDPLAHPAWTVVMTWTGGSPDFLVTEVASEPC